jgi:hypothetical protein
MSLSILITTIGRPTLKRQINSLLPQLLGGDRIYIAIDGPYTLDLDLDVCEHPQIIILNHPKTLGFWGHGLRNYYQNQLEGDFILHGDDDDMYTDTALSIIRQAIFNYGDLVDLFIFQMFRQTSPSGQDSQLNLIPRNDVLVSGNIGTPCGVIRNRPELFGTWGLYYGGDFDFYLETANNFGIHKVKWIHSCIYHVIGDRNEPISRDVYCLNHPEYKRMYKYLGGSSVNRSNAFYVAVGIDAVISFHHNLLAYLDFIWASPSVKIYVFKHNPLENDYPNNFIYLNSCDELPEYSNETLVYMHSSDAIKRCELFDSECRVLIEHSGLTTVFELNGTGHFTLCSDGLPFSTRQSHQIYGIWQSGKNKKNNLENEKEKNILENKNKIINNKSLNLEENENEAFVSKTLKSNNPFQLLKPQKVCVYHCGNFCEIISLVIHESLKNLGYEPKLTKKIDKYPNDTWILFCYHHDIIFNRLPKKYIVYQTEPDFRAYTDDSMYKKFVLGARHIWEYSDVNMKSLCENTSQPLISYVPFGYSRILESWNQFGLKIKKSIDMRYDLAFVGFMTPYRRQIIVKLQRHFNVFASDNIWGRELSALQGNARIHLILAKSPEYRVFTQDISRVFPLGSKKCFILSELIPSRINAVVKCDADSDDLIDTIKKYLANDTLRINCINTVYSEIKNNLIYA